MVSLRYLTPLFVRVICTAASLSAPGPRACPANSPLSCHNETAVENTCCFIPAGQLLQTQFWDTAPATGPEDSWTIHGLWPDNCDGSYPARCDRSRAYNDIGGILRDNGASDALEYMQKYWKDYKGDDDTFWEHEWGKHGTCISTLDPKCYDGYQSKQEAVDFFKKTVDLFKTLPTYKWLSEAGITPSRSKTHSLKEIQSVLSKRHGAKVTLGCKGKVLNEVWYHFNVRGSLQSGTFIASAPDGAKGKCPSQVQYKPKSGSGA
ncbi:Ribonuclease Trv [Metarhizium rileyi]|uniref:ribonuclease T2 n=1 Tax=Metarhizium rileyi (strain RCEF 4871) TaxID=1649241 RepID=A0A162HZI5_METRR|nr:Ribonuclease Trv [Metarhizium rileyi RCEF 4871]TWU73122.1 ribonuclease T2-like [Metarhizium rileyi]